MNPYLSITDLQKGLTAGDYSSLEITTDYLRRASALRVLGAYITLDESGALAAARLADEQRQQGASKPLLGIPIAHKDIFCTEGLRTSCGSKMLDNFIAPFDATVVARMKVAGTITLGKTNMDEFAMGSSNETSYYGAALNPWDQSRVPGGSSGGSACAVAAGLCAGATGTDTGGSIRQPASFCGISGLKPTYGRVSRYGMIAFASSLDQGGPMARSVADLGLLFAAMCGHDPRDATSSERPSEPWLDDLRTQGAAKQGADKAERKMRIGLPVEYFQNLAEPGADALANLRRTLESAGHQCVDINLPHTEAAIPVYYVIASAEASTNLSRYDGVRFGYRCAAPESLDDLYQRSRSEGFGDEVKRRILTGTYTLSVGYYDAYYLKAQKIRRLIQQDFLTAFDSVDMLLTPTAPGSAFQRQALAADPIAMYQQDVFTVPASLAGLPALSLPCGFDNGMPLGAQLIAPHFHERELLTLGHWIQQQSDWHQRVPELD